MTRSTHGGTRTSVELGTLDHCNLNTLDIVDWGLCARYALDVRLDIACAEDVRGYVDEVTFQS